MSFERNFEFAKKIETDFSPKLIDNFQFFISIKSKVIDYIETNLKYNPDDLSPVNFIANLLDEYDSYTDSMLRELLDTEQRMKRQTLKRWFTPIEREMLEIDTPDNIPPSNKRYLYQDAVNIYNRAVNDRLKHIPTIPEIMKEGYDEVRVWKDNTKSYLTDFKFLVESKTYKTQYDSLRRDFLIEALRILLKEYKGEKTGLLLKQYDAYAIPIFSWRRDTFGYSEDYIKDQLVMLKDSTMSTEDSTISVRTLYERVKPDTENNKHKKNTGLSTSDQSPRGLDVTDNAIIGYLFSSLDYESAVSRQISGKISDIARHLAGKTKEGQPARIRPKNIDDVISRLYDITATKHMVTVVSKKTGKEEGLSLSYIDKIHIYPDPSGSGEQLFECTLADDIVQAYINQRSIMILRSTYEEFSSSQARAIMLILQKQRIQAYIDGKTEEELSLSFFNRSLKFGLKTAELKREIKKHLDEFRRHFVIVDEFTQLKTSFKISYTPLSEDELTLYKIEKNPTIKDHTIIDL